MTQQDTIVVTGAAGFIGSYLTGFLNRLGFHKLILVDDFTVLKKQRNLENKKFDCCIDRNEFIAWWNKHEGAVQQIFHLGARTDTTEMDYAVHKKWNLDYSKDVWELCVRDKVPMVYASSAATYGNGAYGYKDDHGIVDKLEPLNPYGLSKQQFDKWALVQQNAPPFWAGVKFFNVYGPNEFHKGRMASVIFHAYHQIRTKGSMQLFRSHNPAFEDGGQMRDFVYVKDVVNMCVWLMKHQPASGLYNAGSGKARPFLDLAKAVFAAMEMPENIGFIDTPEDIRDKYQYFTEADMNKLLKAGYDGHFTTLEEGISDYTTSYLAKDSYF